MDLKLFISDPEHWGKKTIFNVKEIAFWIKIKSFILKMKYGSEVPYSNKLLRVPS